MSKITMLEDATIILSNGASIKIQESLDGAFNIEIFDNSNHDGVRLGVSNEDGTYYQYWKSVEEKLNSK